MLSASAEESGRPHVPPRQVILSAVALWLCYFVLVTVRGLVVELGSYDELLWRRGLVILAGIGVTLLAWPVLRKFDNRRLGVQVAAAVTIMLPAALALALINQRAFAPVERRMIEKIAEEEETKARAQASGAPIEVSETGNVKIRRDLAGNVLVDVMDPPRAPSAPPALPSPPPDPAAPAARSTTITTQSAEYRPGEVRTRKIVEIQKALHDDGLWRQLTDVALGRYFLLIAWAALYLALGNAERVRAAERREGEYRRAAKAAELRSLRYQVNPHFLFNTLNSLSALVMVGRAEQAERMIQTISSFYRHSLAGDPTADVPLADEIALQQHYLEIEAVRFPERLRVSIDVPAQLGALPVPGMILQPLVENAVKYAVAPTARPVTITIAARRDGDTLVLMVSDDGPGAGAATDPEHLSFGNPDAARDAGMGIGLTNVRDRLRARFGAGAELVAGPTSTGYRTELYIPLQGHDQIRSGL